MTITPSIKIKRHYRQLSEKETDALVDAVADMLVTFIKHRKDRRHERRPHAECRPHNETRYTATEAE